MCSGRLHSLSTLPTIALATIALCAWGCRSPLQSGDFEVGLNKTIAQSIARELHQRSAAQQDGEEGETAPPPQQRTTRAPSPVIAELQGRRDELEALGPLGAGSQPTLQLGPDLTGSEQERVAIGLNDAVTAAIQRNLGLGVARLEPAIRAQELIAAQAVFDALIFSSAELSKIDQPQRVPIIGGIPLGIPFNAIERQRFETGIRQPLTTGGSAFVSTDLTRFSNRAEGISFSPDPGYTATVNLGINQPLLRGLGEDASLATIRLAQVDERRSVQQLHAEMLRIAADTENAYWNLVFAWRSLAVSEWLVEQGVEVRDRLGRRREANLDVSPAQYSDAVARVEQRKAGLIRSQRLVRAASDALKLLINDEAQGSIISEAVLYPIDDMTDEPITYDLREALLTAVDERPEIRQAALNIEDARIRQRFAANQKLPLLDLFAQMSYFGLNDSATGAYSELGEGDFIDYVVGLTFELPLGNRAAEARLQQARLQRSSAMLRYVQSVQTVVNEVKAALRSVVTNYELIGATQSFRLAQAENLRTLMVEEEFLAMLTPEFLNLKFSRQETLAEARRQEILALVDFDQALAELYRAMGTSLRMRGINVEYGDR